MQIFLISLYLHVLKTNKRDWLSLQKKIIVLNKSWKKIQILLNFWVNKVFVVNRFVKLNLYKNWTEKICLLLHSDFFLWFLVKVQYTFKLTKLELWKTFLSTRTKCLLQKPNSLKKNRSSFNLELQIKVILWIDYIDWKSIQELLKINCNLFYAAFVEHLVLT